MSDSKSRGAAAGAIFRSAVESTRTPEAAKVAMEKPDLSKDHAPRCSCGWKLPKSVKIHERTRAHDIPVQVEKAFTKNTIAVTCPQCGRTKEMGT